MSPVIQHFIFNRVLVCTKWMDGSMDAYCLGSLDAAVWINVA